jgi:hypothetical protein
MQPDPDPIDLSSLDPRADRVRWDAAIGRVTAGGLALRRLRRALVRRGVAAVMLATAACIALWLTVPRREPMPHTTSSSTVLDWALHDVTPADVLALGVPDAH